MLAALACLLFFRSNEPLWVHGIYKHADRYCRFALDCSDSFPVVVECLLCMCLLYARVRPGNPSVSHFVLVCSPEAKDAEQERPTPYPLDRYSIGTNEETKNNLDSHTIQKVPTPTKPIPPLMVAKPHQVIPTKKKELPSSESASDDNHDEPQFSESKNRSP